MIRGLTISLCLAALVLVGCNSGENPQITIERHKKLAGELRDNKLYEAALDEYEELVESNLLDDPAQANICYLMGKIYYEDLADYPHAAAWYVRARALDPEGSFKAELSRNLVASLQKMGRMVDATRQMAAATDIDYTPPAAGDEIVAQVGERPIWRSEVENSIQTLPPEIQKQFSTPEARAEYLHQYVGMELLFRAAERENYTDDPDIRNQERLLHKKLLVDKYVVDKVMPDIKIDTADVRNFYLARKNDHYDGAPYDSVRAQVFMDYQTEKAQSAFQDYIAHLAEAEKVEFFDKRMK
ncbi:MAG TPA: hypothetical protein PLF13_08435 [candidate division Zixibacteria bacterium]|nr:hypothetical protein [candidate division Zixibacteria bacterium]